MTRPMYIKVSLFHVEITEKYTPLPPDMSTSSTNNIFLFYESISILIRLTEVAVHQDMTPPPPFGTALPADFFSLSFFRPHVCLPPFPSQT